MSLVIRDAVKDDMELVLGLIQQLARFEKEPEAVEVTVDELLNAGFGSSPQFRCFVAIFNGKLVGIALVYFRFSSWKGRTVHLEDLIVDSQYRGLGIGKALYKRVMEYAQECKVRRVEWVVLDWNTPALEFYKASGATILEDWHLAQMGQEGLATFLKN